MKLRCGIHSTVYLSESDNCELLVTPQVYQKLLNGEEAELQLEIYDWHYYPTRTKTPLSIKARKALQKGKEILGE